MADSWLYIDLNKVQKGPIPESVLLKLLEKGIGVSEDTMVWKQGMENWSAMKTVSEMILLRLRICILIIKIYLD
jgi:hypothetical protein